MGILNIEMRQQSPAGAGSLWRGVVPEGTPDGFVRATASVSAMDGSTPGYVHGSIFVFGGQFGELVDTFVVDHGDDLASTWIPASAGDTVEFRVPNEAGRPRVWIQRLVVTHVVNLSNAGPSFIDAPRLANMTGQQFEGGSAADGDTLCLDLGQMLGSVPMAMVYEFFYTTQPSHAIQSGPSNMYTVSAFADTDRDIGGRVLATNSFGSASADAAEAYRTDGAPALIDSLAGPSAVVDRQPGDLGSVTATVLGTAPITALWELNTPGVGWVDTGLTDLSFDLSSVDLVVGTNRIRLTVTNDEGSDSRIHEVAVSEPGGSDVLSWASADFNLGDVAAPETISEGGILWLTYMGDVERLNDRLVHMFGTFEAPAGTKALLQMSLDQLNWSDRSSLVEGLGDPISVSLNLQVEEGVSYWRWVADPDGEFVTSPVATVTITLTADSEPPVLTVDPVASGPGPIVVSGTVTDNVAVVVVGVVFRQNGVNVTGQNAQPDGDAWSVTWNPAAGGYSGTGFVAHVTALDVQGNQTILDSNTFTIGAAGDDVTPPTSTIDTVASGAGVFSLSGTSTDVESGVAEVLVKMWAYGGVQIGPTAGVVATLVGANWTADFDPGTHLGSGVVATVHATDAAGNEAVQVVSNPFSVTTTPPPAGSVVFDNGQPGIAGDVSARRKWFWEYNRAYFEPAHSQINASPQRVVYVSPGGGGNGLTPGSPITLNGYTAIAQPGDQVRMSAGVHDTQGQRRSIQGTAANPIRFVRDDPNSVPIVRNLSGSNSRSTWGFTDSMHLGFHGIEIDGRSADTWGLTFGRTHDADWGQIRCHSIDIWHCHIHHMSQTVSKAAGTQGATAKTLGAGPDNLAHDIHHYANEISHSGQGSSPNIYNELLYTGDGNTAADHCDNFVVEACDLHDTPAGEAVDMKFQQTGGAVVGCLVHAIRIHSQAALTAQNSAMTVQNTVIWDIERATQATGSPHYDGNGVFMPNGLIEDCLIFDTSNSAVGYPDKLGSGTLTIRNVTGWDNRKDLGNSGSSADLLQHATNPTYHSDGTGTPTIVVVDTCTDDGSNGSSNFATADFAGPLVGSAERVAGQPGTGFQVSGAVGAQGL